MAKRSARTSTEHSACLSDTETMRGVAAFRALFQKSQPAKPKSLIQDLQRDLYHGWLIPYLVEIDSLLWGRWDYWLDCQLSPGKLPDAPIPKIDFCGHLMEGPVAHKMLTRCLDSVPRSGQYGGWSGWEHVNYFLDWVLYGFGYGGQKELPEEPDGCEGASMRLYQLFQLEALMLWPYDYLGDMLAESRHGKHNGFFPTPLHVAEMMAQMSFGTDDGRGLTVCDPCLGTGRMLLAASNFSLRLTGMDIDRTVLKVSLLNGYCYAPWMVKPIRWLDEQKTAVCEYSQSEEVDKQEIAVQVAQQMSDEATKIAPPHYQEKLFDTEFDAEALPQTAPLLKRKPKQKTSQEPTLSLDF